MGLDNGVFKLNKDILPLVGEINPNNYYDNQIELCYWRKCWDFRNNIVENVFNNSQGEGYFEIDETNIDQIIEYLIQAITKAEADIDDWQDEKWNKINLANLILAKQDLETNKPKYRYFFYDSY